LEAAGDRGGQERLPTRLFAWTISGDGKGQPEARGTARDRALPSSTPAVRLAARVRYNPRLEARGWGLRQGISQG
jgi:hypothetical protein